MDLYKSNHRKLPPSLSRIELSSIVGDYKSDNKQTPKSLTVCLDNSKNIHIKSNQGTKTPNTSNHHEPFAPLFYQKPNKSYNNLGKHKKPNIGNNDFLNGLSFYNNSEPNSRSHSAVKSQADSTCLKPNIYKMPDPLKNHCTLRAETNLYKKTQSSCRSFENKQQHNNSMDSHLYGVKYDDNKSISTLHQYYFENGYENFGDDIEEGVKVNYTDNNDPLDLNHVDSMCNIDSFLENNSGVEFFNYIEKNT